MEKKFHTWSHLGHFWDNFYYRALCCNYDLLLYVVFRGNSGVDSETRVKFGTTAHRRMGYIQ